MRVSSEAAEKADAIRGAGNENLLTNVGKTQRKFQVYLPSAMFVIVSWVSFLVKPEVVPGRY